LPKIAGILETSSNNSIVYTTESKSGSRIPPRLLNITKCSR